MPSQEDYLDKLLKNMGAAALRKDEQTEESAEEAVTEPVLPENIENGEVAVDLDTLLPEAEESAVNLDALLPEREESAIDFDAILPEAEESAVDLDSLLPEAEESAADLDSLLQETEESAIDLDALLPEAEESAVDFDAILPEAEESAVDFDALLPEAEESAVDLDSILSEAEESALDFDAILPEAEESAVDLDALLPEAEESAIDLDAILPELESEASEPELSYDSFTEVSEEPLHLDDESEEPLHLDDESKEPLHLDDESVEPLHLDYDQVEWVEVDEDEDILPDIGLAGESTVTEDLSVSASEVDYGHVLEDVLDSDDGLLPDEDDILVEDDYQASSDLDALNSMSEDDIERILSAGAGAPEDAADGTEFAEDDVANDLGDDVLGMLEDSDDGDLQEIHQLLNRADNNEAVDDEITALLQDAPPEEDLEKKILGEDSESETLDPKAEKAKEKERQRQEKAEAKKAAKEAKAAAKAAAKEAKAAAKAAKSNTTASEQTVPVLPAASNEEVQNHKEDTKSMNPTSNADDLFDTSILDSIVSEAEEAGSKESTDIISQAMEEDIFNESNLFGDGTANGNVNSGDDNLTGEAESDDGLGFDMGSLFGDSDDGGLGIDAEESGDLADFPDFVDGDNVDNLVSGIDEGGKQKKGLLARIFDFLTEEDEEEENEALQLSDENREILNDLDKEKTKGKKKKKGKKASAKGEDGEEEKGTGKGKPKKVKKPKPEKPKKEKIPEPEPLIPERKLTLKRALPVLLVCASLAVLIIVFINASVDFTSKKTAQEAYYNGDYQTCYQNLYGRDLNEAEKVMFGTSESILRIRLWLAEYELFVNSGEDLRALDSLITAVKEYPKLYAYAVQWNAGDEVEAGYQHLLTILSQNYGLTQEQALEIANARSNIEYTKMVLFIVQGRGFGSWNESDTVTKPSPESAGDKLPDELPEESEMDESNFVNNKR